MMVWTFRPIGPIPEIITGAAARCKSTWKARPVSDLNLEPVAHQ
jgi:hypothetical protein